MIEAASYIGGVLGAAWMGLVLFVGVKSLVLSVEQLRTDIIHGDDE